jgi:hypothetical protein
MAFMIPGAASYNEFYSSPYQLQALGAPGYQGTELQAARVFAVALRAGTQQLWAFFVPLFTRVLSKHSANRDPGGGRRRRRRLVSLRLADPPSPSSSGGSSSYTRLGEGISEVRVELRLMASYSPWVTDQDAERGKGPIVNNHHLIEEGDQEAAVGAFLLAHEGHTQDVEVQRGTWSIYCRCAL